MRVRSNHFKVLQLLHNASYAGAFCFGRRASRRTPDGTSRTCLSSETSGALVIDAYPGYISWQEFEDNQGRPLQSAQGHGTDRRASPPREGPALVQGLVVCGVSGPA